MVWVRTRQGTQMILHAFPSVTTPQWYPLMAPYQLTLLKHLPTCPSVPYLNVLTMPLLHN